MENYKSEYESKLNEDIEINMANMMLDKPYDRRSLNLVIKRKKNGYG